MQSFLPGVALLAKKAGVPIVPAGIIGTRRIIPYGSVIPRPAFRRVIVRFGKPLVFSKDEDTKEILERLRQAVAELIK
jgi:1-acyl-sn-glycerol-3-phosphate acyltransferase